MCRVLEGTALRALLEDGAVADASIPRYGNLTAGIPVKSVIYYI